MTTPLSSEELHEYLIFNAFHTKSIMMAMENGANVLHVMQAQEVLLTPEVRAKIAEAGYRIKMVENAG